MGTFDSPGLPPGGGINFCIRGTPPPGGADKNTDLSVVGERMSAVGLALLVKRLLLSGECVTTEGEEVDMEVCSFWWSWAGLSRGYEALTEKLMSEKQ